MNTESEVALEETKPEFPPLPEKSVVKRKLTYPVPHILKSFTIDEAGFRHQDMRQGGLKQIDHETEIEYSETPVDEKNQVFAIHATNQFNFGGQVMNVINDAIEEPSFRLVPTSPTATEYLVKVGTRVLVSFTCRIHRSLTEQRGKVIYHIVRIFVVLP